VLGTVQFLKAIQDCKQQLADVFDRIDVPQVKPLSQGTVKSDFVLFPSFNRSPLKYRFRSFRLLISLIVKLFLLSLGETLGCTSPLLSSDTDYLIFIADGRFHMESAMIRNPHLKGCYRYDPYSKKMTIEKYEIEKMMNIRL
jgi:diphthamide biosynthesis enzyme Dph1/Dph2-like protein